MQSLLPERVVVDVSQSVGRLTGKTLDTVDQLLLILPTRPAASVWRSLPQGNRLKALLGKSIAGSIPTAETRLANKRQTLVVLGKIAADADAFEKLTAARKLIASATRQKAGTLGIHVAGYEDETRDRLYEAAISAALAAGLALPSFRSKPLPPKIKRVRLLGLDRKLDMRRPVAEAKGNNLARWFTAFPPNKLDATEYANALKKVSTLHGFQYTRFDSRKLRDLGAGAFLAVAQGNDDDSAAIVRLRYRPGKKSAAPDLSLVGKGIIFDTGGTNLKPFASMLDMHGDMQGSAVAVGTLVAIAELDLPLAVDCWLAITENRTGPRAYKSQDVVTAANGKTIQTIHTDAEGRMALADALVLASRDEPGLMIDYATLTGACINAITTRYSGVFTNRPEWHPRLKRTGGICGERVWPFPIGKEFLNDLKSGVADIKQCSASGSGDHILAGSFLSEFVVGDVAWVHLDLSASNNKGGLAHVPTEITGFGVRYTLSLLLDEDLLGREL